MMDQELDQILQPTFGLLHHDYLDAMNIVVNEEFHFLICEVCKIAIKTNTLKTHLHNKHLGANYKLKSDELSKAFKELDVIQGELPTIQGPRPPLTGLPVTDAIACNLCSFVCGTSRTMDKHYSDCHQGITKPKQWCKCKAQRLKSTGSSLWEVIMIQETKQSKSSHEKLVMMLLDEIEQELTVVEASSDHRMVSPWLVHTNWHTYVAQNSLAKNISGWRRLVTIPTAKDTWWTLWRYLRQATETYFSKALDLIDITDELVLKRLNSPNPSR